MTKADSAALEGFDVYDVEAMQDPHSKLAALRAECPVAHSDAAGGYWMVTKYDDIAAIELNSEVFSSREMIVPRDMFQGFEVRKPVTLDPPELTQFRRLLLPSFTPASVSKWEDKARQICRESIAKFVNDGRCDLVGDYAKKLPIAIMCDMFGVSSSIESEFEQWIYDLVQTADEGARAAAAAQVGAFLQQVVDDHKTSQRDDIVTLLLNTEVDGERLSPSDLGGTLVLILIAAGDTTSSTLSSSLLHLATHPEDRRRLVEDPSLLPTATEEFLRFFAPVSLARVVTRDTEVRGQKIKKDDMVLLSWPSANRDEDVFPDANTVMIDRKKNSHQAFGTGPHRCLGAALARLELVVAIEEWLKAIPEFEVEDISAVTWSTGLVWGPNSVQVSFPVLD